MFVTDRLLGLARESNFFIGGVLVYGVTTLYLLRQALRGVKRRATWALAVIIVESPVLLFGVLLGSGLIPWPRSMLPYIAASIVIGPIMIEAVKWLFRSPA
ncbi:MAG: hypothetical protein ACREMB_11220 [Candidatus Rokuibacteriota bacterium]